MYLIMRFFRLLFFREAPEGRPAADERQQPGMEAQPQQPGREVEKEVAATVAVALSLPDLYRAHGFTVTPHLQALIDAYGGRAAVLPLGGVKGYTLRIGRPVADILSPRTELEFSIRPATQKGHVNFEYEDIGTIVGSPVAPVGRLSTGVELLLTEDGRLVGEGDGIVVTWGPPGSDWRAGLAACGAGEKGRRLGALNDLHQGWQHWEDRPLADLYRDEGFTLTPHLLERIRLYGKGALVPLGAESMIDEDGRLDWRNAPKQSIQFCDYNGIISYSVAYDHSCVVRAFGLTAAPVARTGEQQTVLYLTEDGRLIGDDQRDTMMTWGPEGCDWHASIAAILAGEPSREVDPATLPEPPPPPVKKERDAWADDREFVADTLARLKDRSTADFYRKLGFKVTPHLQELIDVYGEAEVMPTRPEVAEKITRRDGTSFMTETGWLVTEFCPREQVAWSLVGTGFEHVAEFMGCPVALVGTTHKEHINLLLAEDGRLVGENDHLIMSWGPRGCHWKAVIDAYLDGQGSHVVGLAHGDSDDPLLPEVQAAPLADLYRDKGFTVTPELLDIIATHGERGLVPPGDEGALHGDGSVNWSLAPVEAVQFGPRSDIALGADHHMFRFIAEHLGPVAPVGCTEGGTYMLLLLADGRLLASRSCFLAAWGPPGCDWRTFVAARLSGEPARGLGALHVSNKKELAAILAKEGIVPGPDLMK